MERFAYIDGEQNPYGQQEWSEVDSQSEITRVGGYPTGLGYFVNNWPHIDYEKTGNLVPLTFTGQVLHEGKMLSLFSGLPDGYPLDLYSETDSDTAVIVIGEYVPHWIIMKTLPKMQVLPVVSARALAPSLMQNLPAISADWAFRFEDFYEKGYTFIFQIPFYFYSSTVDEEINVEWSEIETFVFITANGEPIVFSENW